MVNIIFRTPGKADKAFTNYFSAIQVYICKTCEAHCIPGRFKYSSSVTNPQQQNSKLDCLNHQITRNKDTDTITEKFVVIQKNSRKYLGNQSCISMLILQWYREIRIRKQTSTTSVSNLPLRKIPPSLNNPLTVLTASSLESNKLQLDRSIYLPLITSVNFIIIVFTCVHHDVKFNFYRATSGAPQGSK